MFPAGTGVVGNDDRSIGPEQNNPYNTTAEMSTHDEPSIPIHGFLGSQNHIFEVYWEFREFVRLDLEGTWVRISGNLTWKFDQKYKKISGDHKWEDNGSSVAIIPPLPQ